MRPEMKVIGAAAVIAELRNIAEVVPDNARKVMHRGADRIVKEAKLNTPVDTHNLEESIRKEVDREATGGKRLKIDIAVGGIVDGVNVDEYAAEVHEAYETSVAPNGPGPGTKEKMQANPGRQIGSKFLERAVETEQPKFIKALIDAVTTATRT